jgi:RNA polymerase sigma-70 factor (ECF subfamily)
MGYAYAWRLPQRAEAATIEVVYDALTDGELLELIADRDRDAFDEIYRRYARAVLGLAVRRLGDRGRAEDVTQETFAAVWRSAARYDPERGPGAPWLFTIARNAVVDGHRRAPEPPAETPDVVSDTAGPPEQAEAAWSAFRVHRALETLPEHERQIIELAYWSGLSQSEISDFLNVPLGTVKTRARTGLARMADILEEDVR